MYMCKVYCNFYTTHIQKDNFFFTNYNFKDIFAEIDVNQDGTLTEKEFIQGAIFNRLSMMVESNYCY